MPIRYPVFTHIQPVRYFKRSNGSRDDSRLVTSSGLNCYSQLESNPLTAIVTILNKVILFSSPACCIFFFFTRWEHCTVCLVKSMHYRCAKHAKINLLILYNLKKKRNLYMKFSNKNSMVPILHQPLFNLFKKIAILVVIVKLW